MAPCVYADACHRGANDAAGWAAEVRSASDVSDDGRFSVPPWGLTSSSGKAGPVEPRVRPERGAAPEEVASG